MHPNLVIGRYIKDRLVAVPELLGPNLPGVGGRILNGYTAVFPAVLFDVNANPPTTPTIANYGDAQEAYYGYYVIKVVGKDITQESLEATYDLVKAALHRTKGSVPGGGYITSCREAAPYSQNYRDPQTSIRYPEVGGFWNFIVELITVP